MAERSFKEKMSADEMVKQSNEWLLDKYGWLQGELGAITTEEKRNVRDEILRRMGSK